ncbi:cytochrome c oxidase subunit II [Botrimarina hoheduenensis]|uniref:Cytochrome c oxidase subunit 2 n=1 Tax=Botrimarina hoheduenensis TaxID=2528000 RepID=A0A5C5W7B0_9BACT|nr:c-type cytochrome [Botrimarina hoheduenensis]TWT46758.1 Cytochrome c oxidase subunit 2 precursor [Botrimarina hoheduenensis]
MHGSMFETSPLLPLASRLFEFSWFRDSGADKQAAQVDWLFYAILWICVAFFVLIIGAMVAFVARYYARPGHNAEHTPHHNNTLEAAWSIFPGFIVLWIFGAGFIGYLDLRNPPENAYEIQVIAKKWNWSFVYPNGHIDADLHVPIDTPVKLVMSSDDVLHSLYIPAFRVKMDCVPGRYSTLWFEASKLAPEDDGDDVNWTDEGGFDLFCTEYCGQGHSSMMAKVIVHPSGTFGPWLEKAMVWPEDESPAARGESLYKKRGCSQCHSVDGTSGTGPSFKGTYGTQQLTSAGEIKIDENYLRESILNPMAKIRDGYKGVMPSYQGQLKDNEIAALIWFHKSLNPENAGTLPATWTEAGGVPGQETQGEATSDASTAPVPDPAATDAPADTDPKA